MFERILTLNLPPGQSAFLWGPRQTGKTTLLRQQFPRSFRVDLLHYGTSLSLTRDPSRLLEQIRGDESLDPSLPILIDEIQLVPSLLNEVQRLMDSTGMSFVLCGSSARKLVRGRANLLGGRGWQFNLHPLTYGEIPSFNLLQALNRGLIPPHYQSLQYRRSLTSYVDAYLKEEVFAEGLTRNIPAFARFFETLGFCHGEMLNFSSIARDCGIDGKTVREYFQVLVDTFLGTLLEPFSRHRSRQTIIRTPKFYLFDVGVAGHVTSRRIDDSQGSEFGKAFEHFILMELLAYRSYRENDFPIRYWRTKTGMECDFVLGREGKIAIEVKGTNRMRNDDLKGLRAYVREHVPTKAVLVCNEGSPSRTSDGISIVPWKDFLENLWTDRLIG